MSETTSHGLAGALCSGLALGLCLFGSGPARAEFSSLGNVYLSSSRSVLVSPSPLNPGNRGARIPSASTALELRPEFSYRTESQIDFVLRSRHWGAYNQIPLEEPGGLSPETRHEFEGHSDLSDAYVAFRGHETLNATLGLQNYQWGPAEIISPSNIFYHFNNEQRSFYYKEKGRVLARVNWTPRPDFAVILMVEPTDNRQRNWVRDRTFSPQFAVKAEKQFENPVNSFALVVGEMEGRSIYVGEHFNWSPVEGYSLYGDLRHQKNETHYKPVRGPGSFIRLSDDEGSEGNWATLGVVGFRGEGRVDFRQELIYNQAGYDGEQWKEVMTSIKTLSPYTVGNLSAFSMPGLELRTKSYSYTSLRIPDLGKRGNVSMALRWLASLSQNSSALQYNYEQNLSDEFVLSGEITGFWGDPETEFTLLESARYTLGLRYAF